MRMVFPQCVSKGGADRIASAIQRGECELKNFDRGIVQDEIFDVVNERDEVIGQLARKEVHRQGLKHRAVHVLIFNAGGEIFLQKRSLKKDNHPGVWDSSASGHVDAGEEYDPCAIREAGEELGVRLECAPKRVSRMDAC